MAEKTLVVVESPAKAKTINKYLGSKYIVEASVGHIKDLAKTKLGVDVENDFEPKYITIKGKGDIIKKLKERAKKAKEVLIATDPDREGEAIAWHLAEIIKPSNTNIKRILFNEITKAGVKNALKEPLDINENLFMSQQARRVLDRLIGFQVSPFLNRAMIEKTSKALSAGRVQSVALRLICEREDQISAFKPIDYWSISGVFANEFKDSLEAKLYSFDGKVIKNPEGSAAADDPEEDKAIKEKLAAQHYIRSAKEAKEILSRIAKTEFAISSIAKKQVKRRASSPFTTSLLQQEASRRLGFSNKKTMATAQKLYEGINMGADGSVGLITYMRTDSVRISPEAQGNAAEYIKNKFGDKYLPESPNVYKTKSSNIQDAHEAIRPTSMSYSPEEVKKYAGKDEARLYELIFNRFLASQMAPAIMDQTTISIDGGDLSFRATGSIVVFKGFLAAYGDIENGKGDDSKQLLPPSFEENQQVVCTKSDSTHSQTKPPARYNEASLVKELDELGIGRPSTYAQIVSTLIDREYVELITKSFVPTGLGMDVCKVLIKNFPTLFNVDFTAEMEQELDIVANGDLTYVDLMKQFYGPFTKSLKYAEEHGDIPEIPCPECGEPMIIRISRGGRFLGCSKYPDCRGTKPLPKIEQEMQEKKEPVLAEGVFCDICGKPMFIRESRFGSFYGCTDYPDCKGIKPITTGVKCPKCGDGDIIERYSKKARRKFFGCSRYPDCDYITNFEPIEHECPNCNNPTLEVRYKKVEGEYEKYYKCPECKTDFTEL
jgi:DNA topoisomerase-1